MDITGIYLNTDHKIVLMFPEKNQNKGVRFYKYGSNIKGDMVIFGKT
jgi:hypothetical protein